MKKSSYSVDPFKRLEEQVKDAIAKLKPLIPCRLKPFAWRSKYLVLRMVASPKLFVHISKKEGWLEDGSWACVIECPAGMKGELIGQVMRRSSNAEVKELGA